MLQVKGRDKFGTFWSSENISGRVFILAKSTYISLCEFKSSCFSKIDNITVQPHLAYFPQCSMNIYETEWNQYFKHMSCCSLCPLASDIITLYMNN